MHNALYLFAIAVVGLAIKQALSWIALRQFAKSHGCQPATGIAQSERLLGLGLLRTDARMARERRVLPTALERFEKLGHTFTGTIMGQYFIATRDAENIKSVLSTQFAEFDAEKFKLIGQLVGKSIFTLDGAGWKHSRTWCEFFKAFLRPLFMRERIADFQNLETHVQALFGRLPHDKSDVDLQPLFFQFTFDTATHFLLGESANSLTSEAGSPQRKIAETFDLVQTRLGAPDRMGLLFWLKTDVDAACEEIHAYIDNTISSARENKKREEKAQVKKDRKSQDADGDGGSFLDQILDIDDGERIRSETLSLLLGGRDTTAGVLSNLFFLLSRHPAVWEKLKAEVDMTVGGTLPTLDDTKNLKYHRWVINEALRLYPPIPSIARFANRTTTLPSGGGPGGLAPIVVPKGTLVAYSAYSLHRRRDIYGDDAESFVPERWESLRPGWAFLPFHGGPRVCLGQQFALLQVTYLLARMAQEFVSVESAYDGPWMEGWKLTLSSGVGTNVKLTRRTEQNS